MTETKFRFRHRLDLQMFAGDGLIDEPEDTSGIDDNHDNPGGDDNPGVDDTEGGSEQTRTPVPGEEFAALDEDDYDDETDPKPEDDTEKPPATPEQPKPEDEDKTVQTPEENAKFAEQRRQQQLQAEVERIRQESPEFQLAKQLSEHYGVTPEVMLAQLKEADLKQRAEKSQIPVETLRRQEAEQAATRAELAELRQTVVEQEFKGWAQRIASEQETLQKDYPMLTSEDMKAARDHMLQVLKNPELPLEQVVFSLHGKKITDGIREAAKQEALAQMSGRKGGPLPPQGGKPQATPTLTAEETYVAKQMGLSEADYLKYKT